MFSVPQYLIDRQVAIALEEDIGHGDLTARTIPATQQLKAQIIVREAAVLCGSAWLERVFAHLNASIQVHWQAQEGDFLQADQSLCTLEGDATALLTGERTALNFLQTLSATASITQSYVEAIAGTSSWTGKPVRVVDTRKTLPGLRSAQKYAVTVGGGKNHRHGLYDGVLIKENHIIAAGSITQAISSIQEQIAHGLRVEVEVESLQELHEALDAGAELLLLDNMGITTLKKAVQMSAGKAKLEASGNISLDNIRQVAETGVDFISVGALTKNIQAIDLSMRFDLCTH